ncbi:MAG: SGNH/GDSL hydrolase family protein [Deltaproteobacteria bacterium]|nr:SGNH/GDSL hydrolase family protein [Deltaproteobacteria bacterium]
MNVNTDKEIMTEITLKKKIFFYFLAIICIFILVEITLQGIHLVKRQVRKKTGNTRAYLSPYADCPWAKEYFKEHDKLEIVFEPYYGWRKQEFRGKYINISPEGVRRTWNPEFPNSEEVKTVFCFGGSVLWGSGARDDFTIPSYLSKYLNREHSKFRVINYGEPAYTFTQEIVYFILLLKEGKIPDYVIFFDGVNDIYAAFQSGRTGVTHNLASMRKKLTTSTSDLLKEKLKNKVLNSILTLKALHKLFYGKQKYEEIPNVAGSFYNESELASLARKVVEDYRKNVHLVESLAKAYNFRCFFIWQPVIFNTTSLTAEELANADLKNKKMVFFFQEVERIIRQENIDNFYNFSTIFDNKDKTIFIDFAHLSEEGNEIVAKKMNQLLEGSINHE